MSTSVAINELPSSNRGHIAELEVAADMARQGYKVSFTAESLPYDLLADRDGRIIRVQVKTVRLRPRDGVKWRVIDCTNTSRDTYEDVDLYAGFEHTTGRVYYVTHADLDGRKELWLHPSKIYALE